MTRADFMQDFDHLNIFAIDSKGMVRADSVPMQNAFREICNEEGFEQYLKATQDRIADIESLGRTRELVAKDLVLGAKYQIRAEKSKDGSVLVLSLKEPDTPESNDAKS